MERRWKDFGIRYGELDEVGRTIVEEIIASYPNERLKNLVEQVKIDKNAKYKSLTRNK